MIEAWIKTASSKKVIDFANNNLHLVGYSEPVFEKIRFNDLKSRLYTLDELPEAIPYELHTTNKTGDFVVLLRKNGVVREKSSRSIYRF